MKVLHNSCKTVTHGLPDRASGVHIRQPLVTVLQLGTGLLCLFFYLLCYATLLIKFTYYAQNYAEE